MLAGSLRSIAARVAAMLVAVLLVALALPSEVGAQGTGGSFGGGDWSSGGGGGGGGSSSSDDEGAFWIVFALIRVLLVTVGPVPTLILVALGGLAWIAFRSSMKRQHGAARPFGAPPAAASGLWNQVDVTALHIALDWRARPFVRQRYDELARGAQPRDPAGLARHVAALAQALEEARVAWLRAEVANFHPMSPDEAARRFRELADGARDAANRDASGIADPQSHGSSEGAVVVTLIVAARRELADVGASDANELARALHGVRGVQPRELVAADLVWSPPAEGAHLSPRELEARHPAMVRIAEHSIGARVFCAACRAPYPREMPRCPGCGAENRG